MTLKRVVLAFIILMAALSRLIPHPPNFTPIIAMGLLGGVYFKNRQFAVIVPLLAMMVSDMVLGLHGTMIWVYSSIIVISLSASFLKPKMVHLGFASIGSSLFFFLVTNFGIWSLGSYGYSFEGLVTCYTLAIPFFAHTLISTIIFSSIIEAIVARKFLLKKIFN